MEPGRVETRAGSKRETNWALAGYRAWQSRAEQV